MNEIKKRGRPPKNNKFLHKESLSTTIKNNENDLKKYSLVVSNNMINTNSTINKNIILHLKISKDKIIELEQLIIEMNKPTSILNNMQHNILDSNVNIHDSNNFDNVNLLNMSINDSLNVISNDSSNEIKKKVVNIANSNKIIKNNKSDTDIRRNKIINSGINYKIHKIMNDFDYKEYPNVSSYYCWYCCHPFNVAPVGIPEKIIRTVDGFTFELYGNFCSYNCAIKYISPSNNYDDLSCIHTFIDKSQSDEKSDKIQMLEMLAHIELKTSMNVKIKPAPPRLSLKVFGGKLTIEEFRANFLQHSEFHIYKYPLISINYNLEETTKDISTAINFDAIEENYDYYCKLLSLSNTF